MKNTSSTDAVTDRVPDAEWEWRPAFAPALLGSAALQTSYRSQRQRGNVHSARSSNGLRIARIAPCCARTQRQVLERAWVGAFRINSRALTARNVSRMVAITRTKTSTKS